MPAPRDEYDETVEALNRADGKMPKPAPREAPPAMVVIAGVFLGQLWQAVWESFPDHRLIVNVLAVLATWQLIRWARPS